MTGDSRAMRRGLLLGAIGVLLAQAAAGALVVMLPIYVNLLGGPKVAVTITLLYTLAIAFLMVSQVPVFSGKRVGKRVPPEMVLPVFVLVVGAASTGIQLAEEIHASGRPVTISVGEHVRMPRAISWISFGLGASSKLMPASLA